MPSADPNRTPPAAADAAGHLPLALLRQYAAGTLPAAGQHRVEAHTLACPRCADVLAGLTLTDAATTDQAVAELRQRLHARLAAGDDPATAAPAAWPWLRLAAAMLLLVMSTVAFLWLRSPKEDSGVAAVATLSPAASVVAPEATVVAPAPPPAASAPPLAAAKPVGEPTPLQRPLARRPPVLSQPSDKTGAAVEAEAADAASLVSTRAAVAPDSLAAVAAAPTPPPVAMARAARAAVARPSSSVASASSAPAVRQRVVRGRVAEQGTGQPLPGVAVLVPGTSLGTNTAADGSFTLAVPSGTTRLTFNSIGFVRQEQKLGADTSATLALALAPDTHALNEVVVVRREKAPAPVAVAPLPTGGYRAWGQYLRDSLQYPAKALEDRTEGTVRLRFTVSADNKVQRVEVIRKVSAEIDAEAVRLLLEGPAWHAGVEKGRRTAQPVKLDIPFRLDSQR